MFQFSRAWNPRMFPPPVSMFMKSSCVASNNCLPATLYLRMMGAQSSNPICCSTSHVWPTERCCVIFNVAGDVAGDVAGTAGGLTTCASEGTQI